MNDKTTTKAKRQPGLLELIALLAAVIPCCLGVIAFLGFPDIKALFPDSRATSPATHALTATEPAPPAATSLATPAQRTGNDAGDISGQWIGQFNDGGTNEVVDYILELTRRGNDISGKATAISLGNPNCQSTRPVRGQLNVPALSLALTETLGGVATCPTFPRGSAGDIKTFSLAYDTVDGIPALKGAWREVHGAAWDTPGDITFYRQP